MQAASNSGNPSAYSVDPQRLLGMISKWLGQAKTVEPAIRKCKELTAAGHILPAEIINKLELQLQNGEIAPQTKMIIYQILLALNDHKFQHSTIELFCKDLDNSIVDPKIRELLAEILNRMIVKGYNLFSSPKIAGIFQQHLESDNSHLISLALKMLETSAARFELPENLKHYIKEEDKEDDEEGRKKSVDAANNNDQRSQDSIKTLDRLLVELQKNNSSNAEFLELIENGSLQKILQEITLKYESDSVIAKQDKPIKAWEGEEIRNWSRAIKSSSQNVQGFIPEMLAVIKKANYLNTSHNIRDTQLISLITLFNTRDKGRLLQIATGEGKSTTTAITALVKAITGHKVDVVTSSSILAIRDVDEWRGFFEMFGISSGHNIDKKYREGPKDCYLKDIVYGDAHNFQSDILLDEYKDLGTRGSRKFAESCVIIDEVDSMLVDESAKIVKLSTPMPCMEYLGPIFVMIWQQLSQFTNYFSGDSESLKANAELIQENISQYIKSLITGEDNNYEKIVIPKHLENFAFKQAEFWARSALTALQMTERRDYLIIKDDKDEEVIAPIDYSSTGVIQEKTSWGNGLHQFLQVKHRLKISPESLNTSFISNMQYFKRYNSDRIYGMTGTLGSEDSQDLLKEIYNIDLVFIPSFKPNQFKELEGIVADGDNKWREELISSISKEATKGRAILVICETIEDVENIVEDLQKVEQSSIARIKTYSRSDEDQQKIEKVDCQDVIIATNLAGRGTDIKTSKKVEVAGGLHVILSFLPTNLRVERQAYGRTARQGNQGTGQLIVNGTYERIKLINLVGYRDADSIDELKSWRDEGERVRIANTKNIKLVRIKNEDLLFIKFNQLVKQLKAGENNKYKISQLEERWGLWLKEVTDKQKGDNNEILLQFESFKTQMIDSYIHDNRIMQNPAYLTRSSDEAFIKGEYDKAISILREASALDPVYSFAARYNLAYALLRRNDDGKKNHQPYVDEAEENLVQVIYNIHQYILPQLQMMQIVLGSASNASALSKQITMKISLLQTQVSYIKQALKVVEEKSDGKNLIKVKDYRSITELLDNKDELKGEVLELARFGVVRLFEVEAKSPPKSYFSGAVMTLLGVAQLVVGALVTAASGHPLGVQLMIDGAKDLYHGIRAIQGKEQIDWNSYLINKGVSYAISAVSMGWQKFTEGLKAIGTQVSNLATATKNFFTTAAIQTVGIETAEKLTFSTITKNFIEDQGVSKVAAVVFEVSKSVVIDRVTDIAVKKLAQQLDVTKENIAERVEKKILNALRNEPTRSQVEQLILLDRCSGRNIYSQQISRAATDLLAPKKEMLGQLAQSLGSAAINGAAARSNNSTAAVIAKVVTTVTPMAIAAEKIEVLITEYAADLQVKIDSVAKTAFPRLENFLQAYVSPQISYSIASDIVEILVKNGVSTDKKLQFNTELLKEVESKSNTPIISTSSPSSANSRAAYMDNLRRSASKQENINKIDFGPYQEYRGGVLGCIKQVRNANSRGYDQERDELTMSISDNVVSKVMAMIRGELLRPVVSPIITYGADEIIHHFEEAYNSLKHRRKKIKEIDDSLQERQVIIEEDRRENDREDNGEEKEIVETIIELEDGEYLSVENEPIAKEVLAEIQEEAGTANQEVVQVPMSVKLIKPKQEESRADHLVKESKSKSNSAAVLAAPEEPSNVGAGREQSATKIVRKPWPKNIGVVMPDVEKLEARMLRDIEGVPGKLNQIGSAIGGVAQELFGISLAELPTSKLPVIGTAESQPIYFRQQCENLSRLQQNISALPGRGYQALALEDSIIDRDLRRVIATQTVPKVSAVTNSSISTPTAVAARHNQTEDDFGVWQSIEESNGRLRELSKNLTGVSKQFHESMIKRGQDIIDSGHTDVVGTYEGLSQRNANFASKSDLDKIRGVVDIVGTSTMQIVEMVDDVMLYNPVSGKYYAKLKTFTGAVFDVATMKAVEGIKYVGRGAGKLLSQEKKEQVEHFVNNTTEEARNIYDSLDLNPGEKFLTDIAMFYAGGAVVGKVGGAVVQAGIDVTTLGSKKLVQGFSSAVSTPIPKAVSAVKVETKAITIRSTGSNTLKDITSSTPTHGPKSNTLQSAKIPQAKNPSISVPSSSNTPLLLEYRPDIHSSVPTTRDLASSRIQELIDTNTGIVRTVPTNHQQYLDSMRNIDASNWPAAEQYISKVSSVTGLSNTWVYNKKMNGIKITTADGYHIRVDKGNPLAGHSTQVGDHVAIMYDGNIVDNTGLNYIFYDNQRREMYKISQKNFYTGKTQISNRFGIIKNPSSNKPSSHPDAHISIDTWMQWQHPGHPTASPSIGNHISKLVTEELIDIDSVIGNTKIKSSTSSTSGNSGSSSSGTQRSSGEQKDNEHKINGNDNKTKQAYVVEHSEKDQDNPSPSAVAEDYIDYVLWWVDHITPEWIKERAMNSQPVKDAEKHFKQYDNNPIIEIIGEDELSKAHEQQNADCTEEENSIIDYAEVHYNKEDEVNKPDTSLVLDTEALERLLTSSSLIDNNENYQEFILDEILSDELNNEEMIDEQMIKTAFATFNTDITKNNKEIISSDKSDSGASVEDNLDKSCNIELIILANLLAKHTIDAYTYVDALISIVGTAVVYLCDKHSSNLYQQEEHYACNIFKIENLTYETNMAGNSNILIELY